MIDYAAILTANYKTAIWSLTDNDYSTLTWDNDTDKPTEAQLKKQWPQVDYDNQVAQIETTRRTQYQALSDGLYFEWQRGTNTKENWETAVQAIKDANPYPPSV